MLEHGSPDKVGKARLRGPFAGTGSWGPRPEKGQVGMQMASCSTVPHSARNSLQPSGLDE